VPSRPLHALVRPPSRSLERCELLHLPRVAFDFARAESQHAAYVGALRAAGVTVTSLPEAPDLPDAVFVEDAVVLLDECAVRCRPGVASRRPELDLMRGVVDKIRTKIAAIEAPATLEGGDVLRIGRTLYVGRSTRTNAGGIAQLRRHVEVHGYEVREVAVSGSLHLKTAVTAPREDLLIANSAWIDATAFAGFEVIAVPSVEPFGANTLTVNGTVFVAASAPRTAELLARRGLTVQTRDISELQKAEAGLTCLSVVWAE
jgi:dimethylargininase